MTIAGTTVGARELRAALERVVPEHLGIERRGKRWWVILPDVRRATLDALATELGGDTAVVEVEMPLGGRGSDLFAQRYRLPSQEDALDLSEDAREILHDWISEGGGFDEDEAALQLAWELIDEDDEAPATTEDTKSFEDRWAEALVQHLVDTGAMELRSKHRPNTDVAHELQFGDEELGSRLLAALVASTSVDEIFVDEDELMRAARATRPRRRAR